MTKTVAGIAIVGNCIGIIWCLYTAITKFDAFTTELMLSYVAACITMIMISSTVFTEPPKYKK